MSMATHDRFASLVHEVHRHLGLLLPPGWVSEAGMAARTDIEVDGIAFSLLYDPSVDPGRLRMQCDLGDPGDPLVQRQEDLLMRLLELNFVLMLQQRGTCFGIDPDSGRAACLIDGDLDAIEVDTLVSSLRAAARLASQWRRHGLLDDMASEGIGLQEAMRADACAHQRI